MINKKFSKMHQLFNNCQISTQINELEKKHIKERNPVFALRKILKKKIFDFANTHLDIKSKIIIIFDIDNDDIIIIDDKLIALIIKKIKLNHSK